MASPQLIDVSAVSIGSDAAPPFHAFGAAAAGLVAVAVGAYLCHRRKRRLAAQHRAPAIIVASGNTLVMPTRACVNDLSGALSADVSDASLRGHPGAEDATAEGQAKTNAQVEAAVDVETGVRPGSDGSLEPHKACVQQREPAAPSAASSSARLDTGADSSNGHGEPASGRSLAHPRPSFERFAPRALCADRVRWTADAEAQFEREFECNVPVVKTETFTMAQNYSEKLTRARQARARALRVRARHPGQASSPASPNSPTEEKATRKLKFQSEQPMPCSGRCECDERGRSTREQLRRRETVGAHAAGRHSTHGSSSARDELPGPVSGTERV